MSAPNSHTGPSRRHPQRNSHLKHYLIAVLIQNLERVQLTALAGRHGDGRGVVNLCVCRSTGDDDALRAAEAASTIGRKGWGGNGQLRGSLRTAGRCFALYKCRRVWYNGSAKGVTVSPHVRRRAVFGLDLRSNPKGVPSLVILCSIGGD